MKIENLTYLILVFEFLAAVLATVYFYKYKNTTEKYFLHFLWFVIFTELLGLLYWKVLNENNNWIYIIYIFLSFLFYFYWFFKVLKKPRNKKILVILTFIFVIFSIYNFFTLSWNYYQVPTFICGAVINLLLSLFYFSELLNSNKVLNVKYKLSFWIATGLLLFNIGMVPFMVFNNRIKSDSSLWVIILTSLNIILYTCYSLGFIWDKKKTD